MSLLTIMPSGKTIEVAAGTTLLQAILAAGEKLVSKCGGEAQCGKCHVSVTEGRKSVNRIAPAENAKLDTLVGIGSKSRLSCQVLMGTEPVTVELLSAI
ncbi:MAG: 2Fe-2S iron-sulfur cluster-binding protein [Burkholderiales bacterium]